MMESVENRAIGWINGTERCSFCTGSYAWEVGVYCVDCDGPMCPLCLVVVYGSDGPRCPECSARKH
jgi:hypothetical protein